MNGVAGGGTGITVDGTEANSSPEERSMNQYGSQNQISVMSIDSVAEVQIIKGVLPAEYGGVAGGQVNMISRSGTNTFHGSAFYNLQNESFNARNFFSTGDKPVGTFNQYGGTLGGPVLRNKLFFFTTYEGYYEDREVILTGNVPYQHVRDALLTALPFPETRIMLDTLPLPTEPIISTAGVVDPNRGRYRGVHQQFRKENHVVAKVDLSVFNGANLATTYTRLRPYAVTPRINLERVERSVLSERAGSHRVAIRHGQGRLGVRKPVRMEPDVPCPASMSSSTSEIRIPTRPPKFWRSAVPCRSSTSHNLFSGPSSEILELTNRTLSFDQKFSRVVNRHLVKTGFRWIRDTGNKLTTQNPQFAYQTLADTLANIPQSINATFGTPRYQSHISEFGAFMQDDWRIGAGLVLNLGVRYDYYAPINVRPTTSVPAEAVNLAPPTDLRKLDFGPPLDPMHPYESEPQRCVHESGSRGRSTTRVDRRPRWTRLPLQPAPSRDRASDRRRPECGLPNAVESNGSRVAKPQVADYNDDLRDVVIAENAGRQKHLFRYRSRISTRPTRFSR